ncbi:MAG: hypothetical protein ABW217_04380 [Polyangiaceae bacterium]
MKMRLDNRRTPRRISLGFARVLLVAGAAGGLASCSVLYDLGADQCNIDEDCTALGELFVGKVCQANVCVDPGGCRTNADCIDDPTTFGGNEFSGEPAICREHTCIPLKTSECPLVLPIREEGATELLRGDNPVILGGFAQIPATSTIGPGTRNYDLALTELEEQVGGLPGGSGGVRPTVMVVCQSATEDNAVLDAAIDHLADDLRVPAVVSALSSANLQYVFSRKGREAGMFFMSTEDADGLLTLLPDDNLIWHMLPGGKALGASYAPLLTRTLTFLDLSQQARVAMVVASDIRLLADMFDAATQSPESGGISFNDMNVTQNLGAGLYREVQVPSILQAPDDPLLDEIADLVAFAPNVVIAPTAFEFLTTMIPGIERSWPSGTPRPFYILSPYHFNQPTRMQTLLDEFPDVRTRLVGLNAAAAANRELYDEYERAFRRYDQDNWVPDVENYYDAIYYTLYAGARASTSGADFALGMGRLLSGSVQYGVGRQDLVNGLVDAFFARPMTLNGTLGPPNFDPSTGARQAPASAWCVEAGAPPVFIPDVLRYDTTDNTMQGTMPPTCIPGGF